jgi:hypothetical protein
MKATIRGLDNHEAKKLSRAAEPNDRGLTLRPPHRGRAAGKMGCSSCLNVGWVAAPSDRRPFSMQPAGIADIDGGEEYVRCPACGKEGS